MGNPQEEATALKNKGNEAFKNHDWPKAVDFYTQAIELWDKDPSFYNNRAQVRYLPTPHATTY
jgi:serine/threonine-protein phosphatase 5